MVAVALVIVGISLALELTTVIIKSFRDSTTVQGVGFIKGDGFSNLQLSSTGVSQIFSSAKINKVVNAYLDDLKTWIPSRFGNRTDEVLASLQDMADFGAYGTSSQSYFFGYDKGIGKMNMFVYNFAPISDSQFRAQLLSGSMSFQMANDYAVVATTKKNTWRTEVTQSLELQAPQITDQIIVDSIALMVAPVCSQLDIPDDMKESMEDAAQLASSDDRKISSFVTK